MTNNYEKGYAELPTEEYKKGYRNGLYEAIEIVEKLKNDSITAMAKENKKWMVAFAEDVQRDLLKKINEVTVGDKPDISPYQKYLEHLRELDTKLSYQSNIHCSVCGMSFTDSLGRPKVMGYVCSNNRCPSGISYSMDIARPMTATFGTVWTANTK